MAETKPTNEQIVKMLENVLEELDQLRADLVKLAKTV
jgi:hypothetical protein